MKTRKKVDIRIEKEEIRKEIIQRLRAQDPSLREERSRRIQEAFLSSEEFSTARAVMTYVSLPAEVDTAYIISTAMERGKRVAVPYIEENTNTIVASELTSMEKLKKGPFGIYQPEDGLARTISLKEIDLIVIPAIAYDKNGMRLGRGKGYYDRFLCSEDLASSKTVGLAFSFQIVDTLPASSHDRPVHRVITDHCL